MPISGLVAPVAGDPASAAPIRSPLSAVPGTPELSASSPCRCRWSAPCPHRGPVRRPHRERPPGRRPRTRTARSSRLLRADLRPPPSRPSRPSSGRRSGPCRSSARPVGDAGDGHRAGVGRPSPTSSPGVPTSMVGRAAGRVRNQVHRRPEPVILLRRPRDTRAGLRQHQGQRAVGTGVHVVDQDGAGTRLSRPSGSPACPSPPIPPPTESDDPRAAPGVGSSVNGSPSRVISVSWTLGSSSASTQNDVTWPVSAEPADVDARCAHEEPRRPRVDLVGRALLGGQGGAEPGAGLRCAPHALALWFDAGAVHEPLRRGAPGVDVHHAAALQVRAGALLRAADHQLAAELVVALVGVRAQ